jgi:hypothetical protein
MKTKLFSTTLFITMLAFLLSACSFSLLPEAKTPTADTQASVTAAVSTAFAEMTESVHIAALSATATFTHTPIPPSATPSATLTATASQTASLTPTSPPTETFTYTPVPGTNIQANEIVAYFVQTNTGGPIGCGDTLVPIRTGLYRTGNTVEDLRAALNYLFRASNYVLGLYNATYTSSLQADEIDFNKSSGTAITRLNGSYVPPLTKCDAHRYREQVWSTAYQFDDIRDFTPYVGSKLLGDRLYAVMLNGSDE